VRIKWIEKTKAGAGNTEVTAREDREEQEAENALEVQDKNEE